MGFGKDLIDASEDGDEDCEACGAEAAQRGDERHREEVQRHGEAVQGVDAGGDDPGGEREDDGECVGNGLTPGTISRTLRDRGLTHLCVAPLGKAILRLDFSETSL